MFKVKAKAFTLVELLVVISIIALLLSILMPTLSKVRGQAQSVICSANLRQWGLGFSMYEQEYKGWLPKPTMDSTLGSLWCDARAMGPYLPSETYQEGTNNEKWITGGISVCPSHSEAKKSIWGRSYAFNYNLRDSATIVRGSSSFFLWKTAKNKSRRLVLADGCRDRPAWAVATGGIPKVYGYVSWYISNWQDMNYGRHNCKGDPEGKKSRYSGQCNVLFGDWHVARQGYNSNGESTDCQIVNPSSR